jgi:hypothetical protein
MIGLLINLLRSYSCVNISAELKVIDVQSAICDLRDL